MCSVFTFSFMLVLRRAINILHDSPTGFHSDSITFFATLFQTHTEKYALFPSRTIHVKWAMMLSHNIDLTFIVVFRCRSISMRVDLWLVVRLLIYLFFLSLFSLLYFCRLHRWFYISSCYQCIYVGYIDYYSRFAVEKSTRHIVFFQGVCRFNVYAGHAPRGQRLLGCYFSCGMLCISACSSSRFLYWSGPIMTGHQPK